MLENVTSALAAIKPSGTFATQFGCGSEDLHLRVDGVGPVRFPISAATAKKLCSVARPAPFGRRDQTLTDVRVRDTWQIAKSHVKIDARAWQRALVPALSLVHKRLGMPEGGQLTAVLDKMLVYGPGQFFAPHQDSERADDMVGTLVVQLPSTCSGGAVVVQHHDQKKIFRGAKGGPKDLSLLAFYADCHHEVRPIKSGHRVVLTFHLHYQAEVAGEAIGAGSAAVDVEALAARVRAYFATSVTPSYSSGPPQPPDRLIYLLDHEYTQKSLDWRRLKNGDRLRAGALRQVAERLDCEIFLALADVHESWSCSDPEWGSRRRGWRRWRDDEDEDEDDEGPSDEDYQLEDLIDTDVELRHFVSVEGRVSRSVSVKPRESEVCFTRASVSMDPFQSEHEGYMGNYGNTVDRWYHRAAVVMWPRERDFVIRAKESPEWALKVLSARIKGRALDEAREKARGLLPFWPTLQRAELSADFAAKLLAVLGPLADAELSYGLLLPLGAERLRGEDISAFAGLIERHGLKWAQRLFSGWSEGPHRWRQGAWLPLLPPLCRALAGSADGGALALWILKREAGFFVEDYQSVRSSVTWVREGMGEQRLGRLLALLEAAAVLHAAQVQDELIAALLARGTALPLLDAGALLRESRRLRTPAETKALGLKALYAHAVASLEGSLRAPERGADDWSIEPPMTCQCALCAQLSAFLRDRTLVKKVWPLAEQKRRHVHHMIDLHGLPVKHETTRSGNPYSLVLTKQQALFTRAAALRAEQQALLAWLREEQAAFT